MYQNSLKAFTSNFFLGIICAPEKKKEQTFFLSYLVIEPANVLTLKNRSRSVLASLISSGWIKLNNDWCCKRALIVCRALSSPTLTCATESGKYMNRNCSGSKSAQKHGLENPVITTLKIQVEQKKKRKIKHSLIPMMYLILFIYKN